MKIRCSVIETMVYECECIIDEIEFRRITGVPLQQADNETINNFLVQENASYRELGSPERLNDPIFSVLGLPFNIESSEQ